MFNFIKEFFTEEKIENEIHYKFEPKRDITAYELALVFDAKGNNERIRNLPPEALRHLQKIEVYWEGTKVIKEIIIE